MELKSGLVMPSGRRKEDDKKIFERTVPPYQTIGARKRFASRKGIKRGARIKDAPIKCNIPKRTYKSPTANQVTIEMTSPMSISPIPFWKYFLNNSGYPAFRFLIRPKETEKLIPTSSKNKIAVLLCSTSSQPERGSIGKS